MVAIKPERKTERIVLLCAPSFFQQVTEVADREFTGNRSALVEQAIRDLLERERAAEQPEEVRAA